MSTPTDRGWGRFALLAAHCAGMIDLAALPLWMEVLITDYHLGPQRAGALVSLFLVAAVASSLWVAPRVGRVLGSRVTFASYAVVALAFATSAMATALPGGAPTADAALGPAADRLAHAAVPPVFFTLAACYLLGGAALGCGLSVTHGTIGRSGNAHRLFAYAGAAFGVFAIAFFSVAPQLTAHFGGAALFWLFAGVMATAALLCLSAFPSLPRRAPTPARGRLPLAPRVWFAIVGVSCMALTQALIASFLQRIGIERGFGAAAVNAVLVGLAVVTLLPAPLAALLQRRLPTRGVVVVGPLVQVAVALAITQPTPFWAFAIAGCSLTSVQIFVHTFAFGLIARIDASGRAAAGTPAMLMTGSALGPFMAGTLVAGFGFASLGAAAVVFGAVASVCFHRATRPAAVAVGEVAESRR